MSDDLKQIGEVIKSAKDFRELVENRYKGEPDELRKILIDILCLLHMEFYVRPRG